LKRYAKNPIITRQDIRSQSPELIDVSSVFNPGGIMFEGKLLLLLRVQNRARETYFVKAISTDGIHFQIDNQVVHIRNLSRCPHTIYHIYDARITKAATADMFDIICAIDTDAGCFLGYFTTRDFCSIDFVALVSEPDVRNGVLLEGSGYRFERPNTHIGTDGVKTGSTITCSQSDNLLDWRRVEPVFSGRPHYWDELIGSGPPPLKTEAGWLHIYHGVATHFGSANIYQTGVSLHDLQRPYCILARGKYNILEPRELYELCGQVPNVVFPSAAIPLEKDENGFVSLNSEVYVYYGAADTCVCLAISTVKELVSHAYAK
jgi:beta-1,4-mannooligosaccharide/beta-1,4-mannosyl-N-acetylglucosamine phosphorylase